MDLAALKAELADAAYAGLSDAACADRLNAATVAARVDVPVADVFSYLQRQAAWPKAVLLAREAPTGEAAHDTALGAAIGLVDMVANLRVELVKMSDPTVYALVAAQLGALEAAGIVTADEKAALLAMAEGHVSRAEQLGLGTLTHLDVAAARALA